MGCITSRPWPPDPRKRAVVRTDEDGNIVTDYVIDWPGLNAGGNNERINVKYKEEDASHAQQDAIRHLEDKR
jgi:hypothetical protein